MNHIVFCGPHNDDSIKNLLECQEVQAVSSRVPSGRARHTKLRKVNVNKFSCPTWAKHIFINSVQCSLKKHPTQCESQ